MITNAPYVVKYCPVKETLQLTFVHTMKLNLKMILMTQQVKQKCIIAVYVEKCCRLLVH